MSLRTVMLLCPIRLLLSCGPVSVRPLPKADGTYSSIHPSLVSGSTPQPPPDPSHLEVASSLPLLPKAPALVVRGHRSDRNRTRHSTLGSQHTPSVAEAEVPEHVSLRDRSACDIRMTDHVLSLSGWTWLCPTLRVLILSPRTLDRPAVYELVLQMSDGERRVLMCIKLDKGESPVGLHTNLDDVPVSLKEGDKIGLGGIGDEVANVNGSIEVWCLSCDGLVRHGGGCWGGIAGRGSG